MLTAFDFNRAKANSSAVVLERDPTVTVTGTLLSDSQAGTEAEKDKVGAEGNTGRLLAPSTKYLLRITSGGAGNVINFDFIFAEATPRV